MTIEKVKCRATVAVGGISVSTPFVQSFNVKKQRGQVSTFDASLKIEGGVISSGVTGGEVKISAGTDRSTELIFTGVCRQARISPCYDDPKYVILSISGADALSLLSGKKYTRRCRSSRASWAAITGVVREGLRSGKFAYTKEPTITIDGGKLEKEQTVVSHVGTAVSDSIKPKHVPNKNTVRPAQLTVQILNETPVIPDGGE